MHVTASPKYIFTWNLLFQPKEMSIGISALTVKNVFLKQSCYSNNLAPTVYFCLSREQQKHSDGTSETNAGSDYDNER